MSYTWVRVTTDQVISPNPGCIGSVIVVPSSATKKGTATIYDGESSSDPEIVTVMTLTGDTKQIVFNPPLKTQRGLYLDIGGDTQEVLIQHSWGPE